MAKQFLSNTTIFLVNFYFSCDLCCNVEVKGILALTDIFGWQWYFDCFVISVIQQYYIIMVKIVFYANTVQF